MPAKAAKPKLPRFTVTVMQPNGRKREWEIPGEDLEDAAKRAAKKVCLKGYKSLKRQSGEEGGAGWFTPESGDTRWPFAGPSFKVEPKEEVE